MQLWYSITWLLLTGLWMHTAMAHTDLASSINWGEGGGQGGRGRGGGGAEGGGGSILMCVVPCACTGSSMSATFVQDPGNRFRPTLFGASAEKPG